MSAADCERWRSLMHQRLGGRVRGLEVLPVPGALVLRGRTSSYHVKQLAQHFAMKLTGLPVQINDIVVARPDRTEPV